MSPELRPEDAELDGEELDAERTATRMSAPTAALARLDPQALLFAAVDKGAGIETLERLVALAKDVRAQQAREAFNVAMAEFQRDCPAIHKTQKARITTRGGGSYTYTYAPLDEVLNVVDPIMGRLGLSKSWRSRMEADRVVVVCRISHALGHYEESGDVPMPVERSDGTGANNMQRVGIALSYARRYSLLAVIGKAPEKDDSDAHQEPEPAAAAAPGGRVEDGAPPAPGQLVDTHTANRLSRTAEHHKWNAEQLYMLLSSCGVESGQVKDVPVAQLDAIIQRLKEGPKP